MVMLFANVAAHKQMSPLKNSVPDAISFAVTIPCCANQRGRRYVEDDGRTATGRVVVLLLLLRRSIDSARNIRRLSTENGEQRVILKAMDDCTDAEWS
jgi:hypothetical protein